MSQRQLDCLKHDAPVVLPSLLLCDFARLGEEVEELEAAGAKGFHLDVMDGQFVNNFTYGLPIVEAVRRRTSLPVDVHLMMHHPERYLREFCEAGADILTVHVEACPEPAAVLRQIRAAGAMAGIAINPATPFSCLDPCLPHADVVLVMSVPAGFGGQPFDPSALQRLSSLRERLGRDVVLEVDGGINLTTIQSAAEAGAQLLVVGSAIFKEADYAAALANLSEVAGG